LGIEQHFLLTACAQLLRALDSLGIEPSLTSRLSKRLRLLRNIREHWDEWHLDKGSAKQFRDSWPDQSPFTLTRGDGAIVVAGLVDLTELEELVADLLEQLVMLRGARQADA